MSVEDRVRNLIEGGRAEDARDEISPESDLAKIEGWTEGIEAAVLELARALDALRRELALGSG